MPIKYTLNTKNPNVPTLTDTIPVLLNKQLGSGLKVPLNIINNVWDVASGADKVRQDVVIAVLTPVGRRFIFPSYGTTVPFLMFEEWTGLLDSQIVDIVTTALNTWMPTISNVQVAVDLTNIANNTMGIAIFYTIKGTAASDSLEIVLYNGLSTQLPASSFKVNQRFIFRV